MDRDVLLIAALAATLVNLTTPAHSAELSVARQTARPPETRQEWDLILSSQGSAVSGVQVDLQYDPAQISIEVEGTVQYVTLAPGLLRIIVFGPNPLPDASVARLYVSAVGNSTSEDGSIRLLNAVCSSPEGLSITVQTKDPQSKTSTATGTVSLWDDSVIPAIAGDADTNAVELGLKFRSDVAGQVLGVRFYKGAGDTGTHIGTLWSAAGKRLGAVTFKNETAGGWQQATFNGPISITANTTYLISYYAPTGRYSATNGYFTSKGVDKPPLHGLRNTVDGKNGVYRYGGASVFPDQSHRDTNYWVDVLFRPRY